MRFHRDRIAGLLLVAFLLPPLAPLLGAPEAGSSCRCQGDRCCLHHGRAVSQAQPSAHGDLPGGHGSDRQHQSPADSARHGALAAPARHHEHGSHASPANETHPGYHAGNASESAAEGAACHLPGAPRPAEPKPGGAKLSSTCGAGAPVATPVPVRRDAISGLAGGGQGVQLVSYGEIHPGLRMLPVSHLTEPPTPPPRFS